MADSILAYKNFAARVREISLQGGELREGLLVAIRDLEADLAAPSFAGVEVDPCVFGEDLRSQVFVGAGLGCYSNFELNPALLPIPFESAMGRQALRWLFDGCDPDYLQEVIARVKIVASGSMLAAWYWDGDGVLLVGSVRDGVISRAAVNDDCKKDYVWQWVEDLGECSTPIVEVY